MKKKLFLIMAVVLGVVIVLVFLGGRDGEVSFTTVDITKGDIESLISTTGTINPVNSVDVGSQVSGNILKIYVDFNSKVKAGELLAEIDPSIYRARLLEAKANLLKGEVTLKQSKISLKRGKELYKQKFISESDLEDLEFTVESSEASFEQLKANHNLAATNLENCRIFSPIDGVVIARNIDVGQTVAASFQAPTLFVIGQDLSKMQIEVSIDEADIGRIKDGQPVKFDVDAFPDEEFRGKITQVRLQPEIISNVVTYTVIVEIDNKDMKLKPGMTANVSVIEAERHDTLKLPLSAVRFRMPEEFKAAYLKKTKGERAGDKTKANNKKTKNSGNENTGNSTNRRQQMMRALMSMTPEQREKMRKRFEAKAKAEGKQIRTVYVLNEKGKLEAHRLVLGISDGDYIEIVRGTVKPGQKIVTALLVDGEPYVSRERNFNVFRMGRGR